MTTGKNVYEPVNPHMSREAGLAAMHKSLSQIFNQQVELVERAFPLERYDNAVSYLVRAQGAFEAQERKMVAPLAGIAASIPGSAALYAVNGRPDTLVAGAAVAIGCLFWGAARMIIATNREADVRQDFWREIKPLIKGAQIS